MRVVMPLVLFALSACVSEEEYDAVLADRDALRGRVSQLEDDLDKARGRAKELEAQLAEATEAKPNRPSEKQTASAYSELKISKGDKIRARIETSMGDITCELYPFIAPIAVLNFVALAEGTKEWIDPRSGDRTTQPLYDGTKFHRVIKGFMVQGGDPLGTGRGGPGYNFPDEVWPDVRFDRPGLLAMANAGPNTNGSQFFITEGKPSHLNMKHTIFGACDLETVQRILEVPVGEDGSTPKTDVLLKHVTILRDRASEGAPGTGGGE